MAEERNQKRPDGGPELSYKAAQLGAQEVTEAELNEALAQAYDAVGAKLGLPVAHVGRAFAAYAAEHPEAELYDPDLLHPSLLGSTVAAETILREVLKIL